MSFDTMDTSAGTARTARGGALRAIGPYAVAHALVDASCAALLFSASADGRLPVSLAAAGVLTYNLLAFATQPVLGWFVNDLPAGRAWACGGAVIAAAAFFLGQATPLVWPAIAVAGLGNAVFHIGGGVIALRLEPGRATVPGVFVAPGAIGLAAGIAMGENGFVPWVPAIALLLLALFLGRPTAPDGPPAGRLTTPASPSLVHVVVLLFVVVAVRALVGSGVAMPWKLDPVWLIALTGTMAAGKAAGGVLADSLGMRVVAVGALCLSAPLLALAPTWAVAGVAGMFLFNMTMPVTLVAIAGEMPERPGFASGLTCLALIAGTLAWMWSAAASLTPVATAIWVLGSAVVLWLGLSRVTPRCELSADLVPRLKET